MRTLGDDVRRHLLDGTAIVAHRPRGADENFDRLFVGRHFYQFNELINGVLSQIDW